MFSPQPPPEKKSPGGQGSHGLQDYLMIDLYINGIKYYVGWIWCSLNSRSNCQILQDEIVFV